MVHVHTCISKTASGLVLVETDTFRINRLDSTKFFFRFLLNFAGSDTKVSHDRNESVQYKGVWKYLLISHKLLPQDENIIYMYGMMYVMAVSGYTKAHPG